MIALADASVAIKWFHTVGEPEVAQSNDLRRAHLAGVIGMALLDLTPYEVGNSLLRRHRWSGDRVAAVIDTLMEAHPLLKLEPLEWRYATMLAGRHRLSLYDAAYAAVADARDMVLITADRQLLDGFGRSATEVLGAL